MELILDNVHKSYGEREVLKGISLKVVSGRAMGLLGRNGAGKTTMIRGIMKVFNIDEGKIILPVDTNQNVGYLPEERGVYAKVDLLSQMIYFAELKGMKTKDAKESALKWLKRMELEDYANKTADSLSKGNQQKVQLAISLLHDPDVLILDEPFSGLDPVNAQMLKDVVAEQIAKGKIVFFSSHQMASVEEFCDDIAILNKGKITLQGDLAQIKREYPRDRVELFTNEINKLAEEITAHDDKLVFKKTKKSIIVEMNSDTIVEKAKKLVSKLDHADGFKIVEPTLDEIFVEYAGGHSNE